MLSNFPRMCIYHVLLSISIETESSYAKLNSTRENQIKMQDPNWHRSTSSQYITDEMLAPFVKDFLPTSQIELTLSCRNLINADVISKSDPYCVVWMQESGWQDKYYEIGRTETIDDNLNPNFVKKFIVNYNFGKVMQCSQL